MAAPAQWVWLPAASGGAVGLSVARLLFEAAPWQFTALGTLPGALGLAAVGALVAYGLAAWGRAATPPRTISPAAWAPFALLLPALLAPDVNPLRDWTLLIGASALALLVLAQPKPWALRLFPLFLFLVLFSLYLVTLAPAVGEADTFEFQVGIARLGIAHGSGYPLLMLVGKLFTLLPVGGTLAWRANLTSAFFGAAAGVGAERLARRLGAGPPAALLAGLTCGVAPTLWSRAVEVEAYTLNAAFVAALLLLSLRLTARPPAPARLPALTALCFGLSLTNHLTTLLLAPAVGVGLGWAMWCDARTHPAGRARMRAVAPAALRLAGWALLGLAVYLYVPLRWPAVNHGEALSLAQFANVLSGNEAKGAFDWALPLRDGGRYAIVGSKLVGEYGWAGLALGVLGLGALVVRAGRAWPRDRRPAFAPLIVALAYLPYAYFALAFNVPDPDFSAFLIPLHMMLAALMGVGVQSVLNGVRAGHGTAAGQLSASPAGGLVLAATALLPLTSLYTALPRVSQAGDWAKQRFGELMLREPLALDALVLADSQKIAPLYYLQVAEGVRPDLDIRVLPDEAGYLAALDEGVATGRTVYLGRYLPGVSAGYSLRSVGPLAEVSAAPFTTRPPGLLPPTSEVAAGGVRLIGVAAEGELTGAAPNALSLTLVWQADATLTENLLVNLRLVDAAGTVRWQGAGSAPVSGLYPTNAWRPGEIISDYYQIPIAATLPPGTYRLEAGLFSPFAVSAAGWGAVGAVTVLPPDAAPRPEHLLRARIGADWLLGYDAPEAVAPSSAATVTLFWRRAGAAQAVTALGEARDLSAWLEGELAPQVYHLSAPPAGDWWSLELAGDGPSMCGWLRMPTPSCGLPPLRLAGEAAAEGAYNFAGLILLRAATLETTRANPGGEVAVTLTWQALQALPEDYTVFVHLLGPDGRVHGQVDAWPVSGTRATSGWAPGEKVRDPYRVRVDADAPAGDYQVEIGLYLLATNARLPLLNSDGAPVDDRVLVAGLTIGP
ncbi:MAG: DUF2723 domain-containing protein [Anaerolineales bacterium]|nr:DUF2723 domain-containing protein [Anaerolineales bacterium]